MRLFRISGLIIFLLSAISFTGYRLYETYSIDVEQPMILVSDEVARISVHDPVDILLEGVTAVDDQDGDVTSSIIIEEISKFHKEGTRTITYAAFDRSGNIARAQRTLAYTDYSSPRFILLEPFYSKVGEYDLILDNLSAIDLIDGDLSSKIKYEAEREDFGESEGVFEVEFQVTNSAGDTSYFTTEVEFRYPSNQTNKKDPIIYLSEYVTYTKVGQKINAHSYIARIKIGDDEYNFVDGVSSSPWKITANQVRVMSHVNYQEPGEYTIDYAYTTEDGHRGTTTLHVIVEEMGEQYG